MASHDKVYSSLFGASARSRDATSQAVENRAVLGGWVGAREAGLWDTHVSDAVAKAAVAAVMDLFRDWAAECGEDPTSTI